jgi:vancomycin resistance protein YoaR
MPKEPTISVADPNDPRPAPPGPWFAPARPEPGDVGSRPPEVRFEPYRPEPGDLGSRPPGAHFEPAQPQPAARPWWRPESVAAVLGPLRRMPRPVLAGLLVLVLVAGLVAAQELSSAGRVRRGVRVGGVDLSGLTRAAAADRLAAAAEALEASPLTLRAGAASRRLARSRAGVDLDVEASVAAAMDVGRGGLLDADRFTGWFRRIDLPWAARVARAPLHRQLAVLDRRMGSEVREPTLRIGGRVLGAGSAGAGSVGSAGAAGAVPVEVVAGRPGKTIDRAGAEAALLAAAAGPAEATVQLPLGERPPSVGPEAAEAAADRAATLLEAPVEVTAGGGQADLRPADLAPLVRAEAADGELRLRLDPAGLDRLLRRQARFAYTEPRDARFQPSGSRVRILPGTAGLEVIPAKAATAVLQAGTGAAGTDRSAALPTKATQPELTTKEAKALGVKEVMSTFTTTFSATDAPRVHNIGLIAAAVHGSLVRPGQVFSMNGATGQRTAAKGYRTAHVIQNGELVDGLGGGVCQAGTTMFNAAFFAGLPVVERRNHSLHISHYPMGRDATLNWPGTDLKFRNDSPYGIYITSRATPSSLTFTFWSTSRGYKVTSSTSAASNFRAPPTRYKDDPALPKGKEVVEESGSSGFDVTVSRTVTKGGTVIRRDSFVSNYSPWVRVVRRGTGPAEASEPGAGATATA